MTMPQANRSALIKSAICSGDNFSARPMISGTATAPAYITSTCWKPSAAEPACGQPLVDRDRSSVRALQRLPVPGSGFGVVSILPAGNDS